MRKVFFLHPVLIYWCYIYKFINITDMIKVPENAMSAFTLARTTLLQVVDTPPSIVCGNLLSFLLRCGTRPFVKGTL